MLFRVTNNTTGPRAIFHGGRHTHLVVGECRPITMTQDEAENAAAPGLEMVEDGEGDALQVEPRKRAHFALADDASGAGCTPLDVPAGKFFGVAVAAERPTDADDYHWQAVTIGRHDRDYLDDEAHAADEETIQGGAGDDTIAGAAGDDTISAGAGNDATQVAGEGADTLAAGAGDDTISGASGATLAGGQGSDTLSGSAAADAYPGLSPAQEAALDRIPGDGVTKPGGSPRGGNKPKAKA